MKKIVLTLVVLFSPVLPVVSGQSSSAHKTVTEDTLEMQMPTVTAPTAAAQDQTPAAQNVATVAEQTPAAQPAQSANPQSSGQPAAAPNQAPAVQDQQTPAVQPAQTPTAQDQPAPVAQPAQTPAQPDQPTPAAQPAQAPADQEPQTPAAEVAQTPVAQTPAAMDTKGATPEEIVAAAEKQADLLGGQPGAFELDVNFSVSMNRAMVGHMELRWESKDHWWRHIEMDNFTQTMMRSGGKIYTSSNIHFMPAEVTELINLLGFAEDQASRGHIAVSVQNDRRENGVKAQCMQTSLKDLDNQPDELCLSATSHDILSDYWKASPDQRRKEVFTHYMTFGNFRYPGELELAVNGKRVLVANVTNLSPTPFDESLLDPLKKLIQPQTPSESIAQAK
jgi:hypothetical protein